MASKAQTKASRAWEKRNPERTRYMRYKSTAKTFIRKYVTQEDLEELKTLIADREEVLLIDTDDKGETKKAQSGIIKNAHPLNIDKPRGYQLNSADNKKALENKAGLYSFRSK